MPSALTLSTLRDRVEALLVDSTNAVWATGTIDEAITHALDEYSNARARHKVGTITLSSAGREISLSTLTGLLRVERVWCPYLSTDDEPLWRRYEQWDNDGAFTLYITDGIEPVSTDVVRVFYALKHTLNGLASASATTFSTEDESLLVLAAAGYCCYARAVDLNEDTTQNALAVPNYRELGDAFLKRFRGLLNRPISDNPGVS